MNNTVRLNTLNLNYYILQIYSDSIEYVDEKLTSLAEMEIQSPVIAIEFFISMNIDEYNHLLSQYSKIALNLKFDITFVISNQFVKFGSKTLVPVINLDLKKYKKQELIIPPLKIYEPIRNGAVVSYDGDIIILGLVSNNAEIIAGGDIHIYGSARGKIIAGSCGNKCSEIFLSNFNAELVSIAGIYRVFRDKHDLYDTAVRIILNEDALSIIPI